MIQGIRFNFSSICFLDTVYLSLTSCLALKKRQFYSFYILVEGLQPWISACIFCNCLVFVVVFVFVRSSLSREDWLLTLSFGCNSAPQVLWTQCLGQRICSVRGGPSNICIVLDYLCSNQGISSKASQIAHVFERYPEKEYVLSLAKHFSLKIIFFSCPGQLNSWHCLSHGPLEPTNN